MQRERQARAKTTVDLGVDDRAPRLIDLNDPRAADGSITGAKAARLARASHSGLPVMPGFVVTTATVEQIESGTDYNSLLESKWLELSDDGKHKLVVRSSSRAEDLERSSMAGRFESVVDVGTLAGFLNAIRTVIASRNIVDLESEEQIDAEIAVLVQRQLDPAVSGVMFGADIISGDIGRITVSAVSGNPHELVAGRVDGTRMTLSRRGRLLSSDGSPVDLGPRRRRGLARLAARVAEAFDGPQDVEWAYDDAGRLWLFQSRPITTTVRRELTGPVYGPGPIAETFPRPLSALETDLWLDSLRNALRQALIITRSASRKKIEDSNIIVSVGGSPAADLELLGLGPERRGVLARIDPRPPMRRLAAGWRVGKLRAALPGLIDDLLARTDEELQAIPRLQEIDDDGLLIVLDQSRYILQALHGHEVLAGMLLGSSTPSTTAASVGLSMLATTRSEQIDDVDAVHLHPVVLSLTAPAIGIESDLPATSEELKRPGDTPSDDMAIKREALRLRARWVQELTARAALELGRRLSERALLPGSPSVRDLTLGDLRATVERNELVMTHAIDEERAVPLPAAFRLTTDGEVVAIRSATTGPRGAGGGRGVGAVVKDGTPDKGDVLVVRTLDPALAPRLPGLAGLVSETGSPLSHLAILAREYRVPTVVGFQGAIDRFPEGASVVVDGDVGEVRLVEEPR